jgi:hypothetical protein
MDLRRLRQRVSSGGFRPFALMTSDAREYAVRHPELVLIGPRSVAVLDGNGEIVTVSALHVAAIRDLRARTNGSQKR